MVELMLTLTVQSITGIIVLCTKMLELAVTVFLYLKKKGSRNET